jgi:hypothetical protein
MFDEKNSRMRLMESQSATIRFPRLKQLSRLEKALRRLGLRAKDLYSTALPRVDAPAASEEDDRSEPGVRSCRHRYR